MRDYPKNIITRFFMMVCFTLLPNRIMVYLLEQTIRDFFIFVRLDEGLVAVEP